MMTSKHIATLVLFLAGTTALLAQTPSTVQVTGSVPPWKSTAVACGDAGTASQALLPGSQSIDVEYLCLGDSLLITHDGNFDLSNDPVFATAPGISYIFYDCAPSVDGPTVLDIEGDPCITNNPPSGGAYNFYVDGVVNAAGSGIFTNQGLLQAFFSPTAGPVEFYFAPATIDDHAGLSYEGGGNCVAVSVADSFRVVYLNALQESLPTVNACDGSFVISGGLPEFDGSNYSSISVSLATDFTVTGTVTSGPVTHGGTVTFTVPQNGVYNVAVQDGKSCGAFFTMTFDACSSTTPSIDAISQDSASCSNTSDGSITLTVSQGVAPYTVAYQNADNSVNGTISITSLGGTGTIPNLLAGEYTITVTGNNSASTQATIDVLSPPTLGASSSTFNPLCNGEATGSLVVTVGGGTAPYSFLWNNNAITQNLSNMASGFYSVTVSDFNNCQAVTSATLFDPPAIGTNMASVDALCAGAADGEASVNASGGTGDLSFLWSDPAFQNTATATGLDPGRYFVTVTDANGCQAIDSVDVGATTTILANAAIVDVSCNGAGDGSISLSPSALGVDNGGYAFAWSANAGAGPADASATGLSVGIYNVVITDALGCSIDSSYAIVAPAPLQLSLDQVFNESCQFNDGSASVSATGGTLASGSAYQFLWSDPAAQTSAAATGLAAGNYTVNATDDNGCTASLSVLVGSPQVPSINQIDVTNLLCANQPLGELTVFASPGGAAIVGYNWSNNQSGATISNLFPGTYTVTVTAADGCTTSGTATVTGPAPLVQQQMPLIENPSCPAGTDGSIVVSVSGGTAPYTYNWSVASGGNSASLTGIGAGIYAVTVTDFNSCELVIANLLVEDPPAINIQFTGIQAVSCAGSVPCDGQATITGSGGISTVYSFTFASGEFFVGGQATATQLCAGTQNVLVTDGACTVVASVTIPEPAPVTLATASTTDVSCFGLNDGTATVTGTGGSGTYAYVWSNNAIGSTVAGLSPGVNYTVTISDNRGCTSPPISISVNEPDPLAVSIEQQNNVSCNGDADGFIALAVSGGNFEYTYQWTPNAQSNGSIATNLAPGTYAVTVTDQNACRDTASATIVQPALVTAVVAQPEMPNCFGEQTFVSVDTAFGGNGGPYLFTVDGFNYAPVGNVIPVFAGDYTVEVIDINGCAYSDDISVDQPGPVIVELPESVEIELGSSYEMFPQVIANQGIDSIVWTTELPANMTCTDCLFPTVTPQEDQLYRLVIFDANGCFGSADILVDVDKNRNVFVPNVFSPNDDGYNDVFRPFIGTGVQQVISMQVYNRWGELMYLQENFLPDANALDGWDGYFKGKLMNPGVFVYIIEVEFIDGLRLTYKGDVMLMQ